MNLSEVISIESRISDIESELEKDISDNAKDTLHMEIFRLEDRLAKIYGDREKIYSMDDDDD